MKFRLAQAEDYQHLLFWSRSELCRLTVDCKTSTKVVFSMKSMHARDDANPGTLLLMDSAEQALPGN